MDMAAELAQRHGVDGQDRIQRVSFRQTGRMRQGPETSWMDFRARQTIETMECGFDWRARTGPLGLVSVRDALADGAGLLQVRAFGIVPVANAAPSPEITRGERMRYLAELPWCPHAIRDNKGLRWREDAAGHLVVAAGDGAETAEVQLEIDGAGRIIAAFAPDRPRSVGKVLIPTPWQGRFFDYGFRDGLWLPERGEVGWILDGEYCCCWQGRISDWRAETIC